jgi:Family of unknown function (DUF6291)
MADNKNSFVLYCDIIHVVDKLPNEKAGELFKHILKYVNDQDPKTDDLITNISFEPIKQSLKRDLNKWADSVEAKSVNGRMGNLKRWNLDLYKSVVDKLMTIENAESIAKSRKMSLGDNLDRTVSQDVANIAVSVSDSVSVSVSDIISNDIIKEKGVVILNWKNDFKTYLEGLHIAINTLLDDKEWRTDREKFYPNVDIKLTLEKAYKDFWGTEAGWMHKKKKRTATINWRSTLNNAIDMNKIYKPR